MFEPFTDITLNGRSNEIAAEFIRDQTRSTVKDPTTAELLCPNG